MIAFLGLLARAGHGKSTLANHLARAYDAEIVSLATPLKAVAKTVMGFSDRQLYGTQAEKEAVDPRYGFSPRRFLQLLGTDGLRVEFGPDVFLEALKHKAERRYVETGRCLFVIDDVRFPNEAAYVDQIERKVDGALGAVVKLVCTDAPAPAAEMAGHASESEIDRVPESNLAATIVSARALGVGHLISEFERAIATVPWLAPFARFRR